MPPRHRPLLVGAALCAAFVLAPVGDARAEPTAADKQRAGAKFDEAVRRFNRAEFAEAARTFLEADGLAPSATAITNAIAAARRANDHLLVARVAERAIVRGDALVEARAALAEAATRLARITVACDATPCAITIDGAKIAGDAEWVLPGTQRLEARGPAGAVAEERVVTMAGATYRIALHPTVAAPPPRAVETKPSPSAGLPKAIFFAGAGVTVVLAGVTTWSGLDALAKKRALPKNEAEQSQIDDVLGRARRTDWLLLGTGLATAGTIVVGAFTSFRSAPATAAIVPIPGGVAITGGGRF